MKKLILLSVVLLLVSCASNKLQYSDTVKDWESVTEAYFPSEKPQYVLYSIGDAGYLPDGSSSNALVELKKMMDVEDSPSGVVFLGDNIYPSGMPKSKSDSSKEAQANRKDAQDNIDAQIAIVKSYDGEIFFIPGNHDWRQEDAQKGIQRQEKYIEKELKKKVFFPNNGCPGPVDFKLSKDVMMIVIDSEWYLQDWDKHIDFNEKCLYKTRYDFMYELTDLIKKYCKDKRLVIALHHPIYTAGVHGGNFAFKDHLFPLSNLQNPICVPLPVVGSLYPILRKNVAIREDINGEEYKELRAEILKHSDVFDDIIFLSGHEHNMQYIYREDHHHIISGSGSKTTPVGMGEGSEFSLAEIGFAKISFMEAGETWIEYFSCKEGNAKLVYAKKLTDKLTEYNPVVQEFEPPKKPFVELPITESNMDKGGLFRFFMGGQYSELYNKPIRARVTNLSIKEGGLQGEKRGGGFQTNSVRLQDSKERDWVMRAMKKDATRLLPDEFVGTAAVEAVDYFLTTAHPLAAFTISPMAESIDILHTKPELVYIPKQVALGEFNDDHGNQLYLFEDRPAGNRSDRDNFGNSEKIISTDDLIEKMKENGKHRPDQSNVVRNRLFDMIIGDWDRHDDQWRWARFDGPDKTRTYKPVPRDRDAAYSIFEGVLLGLGRIVSPGTGKFQSFDHKIRNVEYFNYNARYFDRSFLNELTWEDWSKEIKFIQSELSDDIIHTGVNRMQVDFYDIHGTEIESKVKSRRNKLEEFAKPYYKSLAKAVNIHGTYNRDLIEVIKSKKGLLVKLSEVSKDGEITHTYYQRIFHDHETKEVRIYGLDGQDKFVVSGSGSQIKVRMIGGTDGDEYTNSGKSSRNHVYDYPENTEIKSTGGIAQHLSNDYNDNTYDRKEFKYNHSFFLPLIGANPDNGFMLGGLFIGTRHGFKKDPYKASHTLTGLYSFETEGFKIGYKGHFIDAVGKWNLILEGNYQNDLFTNNYFGQGNETTNPEEEPFNEDKEFNRVRHSILEGKLLLEKEVSDQASFYLGPKIQNQEVTYSEDRFISMLEPDDILFNRITYIGGEIGFDYKNVDDEANPHQGIDFSITGDFLSDIDDYNLSYTGLKAHLSLYVPLDNKENFIWAHKIGTGFTFGDKSLFYHQQQIGGTNGLRGYRNERFLGTSSLYYNTDLRIRLFSFNSYFAPSTVGVYGGFDVGRVWIEDEESDTWHTDIGGGLWISPFDMVIVKVGYFTSGDEIGRLLIGVGFDF